MKKQVRVRRKHPLPQWFKDAFRGLRIESTREVCFGSPRLIGTRLTAECMASRFAGGDTLVYLADEYGVRVRDVCDAIRFVLRVSDVKELDMDDYEPENLTGVGRSRVR